MTDRAKEHSELRELIAALKDEISELTTKIAVMTEREAQFAKSIEDLGERIKPIEKAATQYASIFAFVLAIGGLLSAIVPVIYHWWKG